MSFAGIYEGGVGVLLGRNALVLMVVDSAGVSANSRYRLSDRSSSRIVSVLDPETFAGETIVVSKENII
jgi:hypothetical protein